MDSEGDWLDRPFRVVTYPTGRPLIPAVPFMVLSGDQMYLCASVVEMVTSTNNFHFDNFVLRVHAAPLQVIAPFP